MNQEETGTIWSKWIFILSIIVIIAGFCFSFVFTFLLPQAIEPFFSEITGMTFSGLTEGQLKFHNLLSGVIGGVMIGWGLLLAFMGYRLMKRPEDWIWGAIAVSLVVWYIVDTLTSILVGSSLNVMLNTVIFVIALPPLIINRNRIINGLKA